MDIDAKRLSRQARRRDSNQTGLQSNVTLLWRRTCPVSGPMTNSAEHNPAPKRAPGSVTPDHGRRRVFSSRSSPISTYNRRFFFLSFFFSARCIVRSPLAFCLMKVGPSQPRQDTGVASRARACSGAAPFAACSMLMPAVYSSGKWTSRPPTTAPRESLNYSPCPLPAPVCGLLSLRPRCCCSTASFL